MSGKIKDTVTSTCTLFMKTRTGYYNIILLFNFEWNDKALRSEKGYKLQFIILLVFTKMYCQIFVVRKQHNTHTSHLVPFFYFKTILIENLINFFFLMSTYLMFKV